MNIYNYNKNKLKCKQNSEEEQEFLIPGPFPKRGVLRKDNEIYFYDDIDEETQVFLQIELENAKNYLVSKYAESVMRNSGIPETIILHINSSGGLLSSSLAIYDLLKNFPLPIIGVVEGEACSGATIMLIGCNSRTMLRNSVILCHELRSAAFGKYSYLKDSFKNTDTFMNILKRIYLSETNIPESLIDELLSHDIVWDASMALEYGIVDYIIGDQLEENMVSNRIELREEKFNKLEELDQKSRMKYFVKTDNDKKLKKKEKAKSSEDPSKN